MKHLNPEGALFQVVVTLGKSLFHDVAEQLWIAFAGSESTVAHNLFELQAHELAAIAAWEQRLQDPAWTAGPELPALRERAVKIREGVWCYERGDLRPRIGQVAC